MWRIWCIPDFFSKSRTLMWLFTETFCNAMEMAFHWKQYHKWSSDAWLLCRDTGPCHAEFLAKHIMPVVPHLLYSIDFAPMPILMLPQAIACPKWEAIWDVVGTTYYKWKMQSFLKHMCHTHVHKRKDSRNHCVQPWGLYVKKWTQNYL